MYLINDVSLEDAKDDAETDPDATEVADYTSTGHYVDLFNVIVPFVYCFIVYYSLC